MKEHLSAPPEHLKGSPEHENPIVVEHSQERQPNSKEHSPPTSSEKSKGDIEKIKKSIESTALSGKEYSVTEKETPPEQPIRSTKELKKNAYRKVIKRTQSRLKGPEKTFSKFIHRPNVEKISDLTAKSVARPSGFLTGSIFAFLVSLAVFYVSKRNGFEYNYLLFVLVFVGGYFLGLMAELILWLIRKPKRR